MLLILNIVWQYRILKGQLPIKKDLVSGSYNLKVCLKINTNVCVELTMKQK